MTRNSLVTFDLANSDNYGITGWMITLDNISPAAESAGWLVTQPASYNLPVLSGTYSLYVWAKDAAGNVSDESGVINISLDIDAPVISQFSLTSASSTEDPAVHFIADGTDNFGITGWIITVNDNSIPAEDSPSWQAAPINTFTLPVITGTYTLYIWAKDTVNNISNLYTAITVELIDITKPLITDFNIVSEAMTDNPQVVFSLDGTDFFGITGWMITLNNVAPSAGDPGWLAIKPISHTLTLEPGTYLLYVWAKDDSGNVSDEYTPIQVNIVFLKKGVGILHSTVSSSAYNFFIQGPLSYRKGLSTSDNYKYR